MEQKVRFRNNLAILGEMAAGIAHEIRNPLAALKGAFQLLREQGRRLDDEELQQVIVTEIDRLDAIVLEFIGFARDDQEHPVSEDLCETVSDVIKLFEKGRQFPMDVIWRKPEEFETIWIRSERGRMKKVIWNLLKNAEKAVEFSKKKKIEISLTQKDGKAILEIRDSGIGIPPKTIDRVFEPYFSTFSQGLGLGLPISKTIVERINGRITVESTPGEGALFRVILPLESDS
ncbi:MAG: ATP-binding protein [Rhodopseudomonas palustris]|nr:ATP-binding protein [Rhodopseudomonas palustris]